MHILFLTDNFPPEVNAPAARTHEHCRCWVRAGHRVTVITGSPNFPSGRPHPGYGNPLWRRERLDGIAVVRVWTYISANEGLLRRSLDYASYMAAAVLAAPFVRDVDVVVATSPQIFTACAGAVIGALRRKPFVFELRDLWPESIRAVGAVRNAAVLAGLERLELFLYRRAAAIVTVTRAFRDNLVRRGVDGGRIAVVTNGADLSRFVPRSRDAALADDLGLTGRFVCGYVGTHGMAHCLDTVLDCALRLQAHPQGRDIRFLFVGDGAEKAALQARAQALGLTTVLFLGAVSREEVPRYWSVLDASIVHLKAADLFTTVIPSKLFEALAMGVPVLHGVRGESAGMVEAAGAGLLFAPEDAEALAEVVLKLAGDAALRTQMGDRARQAALRYDRTALAADMLAVIERAALTTASSLSLAAAVAA